jgi:WhiB family transcriptional regulator, redox-sensing transcriptional regulator
MSWETRAACRLEARQLFFGPDGESPSERELREERAKAICAGCVVRVQCLQFALAANIRHGVWGGLTENERRRLRRRQRRYQTAA